MNQLLPNNCINLGYECTHTLTSHCPTYCQQIASRCQMNQTKRKTNQQKEEKVEAKRKLP